MHRLTPASARRRRRGRRFAQSAGWRSRTNSPYARKGAGICRRLAAAGPGLGVAAWSPLGRRVKTTSARWR
ncbi:hypothetical protein [Lysobacter gummosus]|uniref:hypothetical protein n=1 Tax=Lysobacter gummosus TaxID=262324 RepID=UPI00362E6779